MNTACQPSTLQLPSSQHSRRSFPVGSGVVSAQLLLQIRCRALHHGLTALHSASCSTVRSPRQSKVRLHGLRLLFRLLCCCRCSLPVRCPGLNEQVHDSAAIDAEEVKAAERVNRSGARGAALFLSALATPPQTVRWMCDLPALCAAASIAWSASHHATNMHSACMTKHIGHTHAARAGLGTL